MDLRVRTDDVYGLTPRPVSRDRINAVLWTIELERNADVSFEDWCARHGIRWDRI